MPQSLQILDTMPSAFDFYRLYWNKRPFVVRGGIEQVDLSSLISADELAGLSMDEAPQSRMVMSAGDHKNWSCAFGPFEENDFDRAGDADWSLLVQNVEQFHPDTASLLRHFNFAPRWLMDDIMVSFSAPGGSVGAHIDNYHVFLVQGQGKRCWSVGREPIQDEVYVQGLDFKLLEGEIQGDRVELSTGDVLYLPPRYAHEGTTIEAALTYSVGFLGPKMSELLSGYGQYISDLEDLDQRYVGEGVGEASAAFVISPEVASTVRERLADCLEDERFTQWLVAFFTKSSHENFGNYEEREKTVSVDEFVQMLQDGVGFYKPEYVKFAITSSCTNDVCLGFDAHSFALAEDVLPVVHKLMKGEAVTVSDVSGGHRGVALLCALYNHEGLEVFEG